MKTIGMIGGMSWESSKIYYELMNLKVKELLGGFHSCKCIMYSMDFAEVERLQSADDWAGLDVMMADAAMSLEQAGADGIILCTNTMHLSYKAILSEINIPFLHIADVVGEALAKKNMQKVGLLGTRFTMEKGFYAEFLTNGYGVDVIIPSEKERETVHNIIYGELVHGKILDESREKYKEIIGNLAVRGAQGVVLGCTEIPLLISSQDASIPVFDTTQLHAEYAVTWALG
jgi:aspartate racemase